MDNNNGASNTNTILIVIVLVILVAFGVWWFTMRTSVEAPAEDDGFDVDLNFGGDGAPEGGSTGGSGGAAY